MRDCCNNVLTVNTEDVIYKEVVVIGNGPSGIILSYILSGNWPYYNGGTHPDEMLTVRLRNMPQDRSLLEQDLDTLAQGLEGRSRNPVSVLIDNLNHPLDDQNLDDCDACLVEWKHNPEACIDHVVIGKGKPGGSWQILDGDLTTISLSSWMELPKLPFSEWESMQQDDIKCNCNDNKIPKRVKIKYVAQYYDDYVEHMRLSKNFRNFSFATSLKRIKSRSSYKHMHNINLENMNWEVEGYDGVKNTCFKYICRYVVLATGTSDIHNTLNVPGELSNPDWVFHDLKPFETAILNLLGCNQFSKAQLDHILIVGSGLSAADAVLVANRHGLPIIHVFNSHTSLSENKFPKHIYSEYHRVYKMMKSDEQADNYKAMPQHTVLNICRSIKGKRVRIMAPDGQSSWQKVSLIAVMVGYRPELNFLPPEFDNGRTLGCCEHQPIDSRKNPIAISPWSHEVVNSPKGLYAMGPLVGDNIVRVIPGGAVAIASHLIKQKRNAT